MPKNPVFRRVEQLEFFSSKVAKPALRGSGQAKISKRQSTGKEKIIEIYIDGASSGNPGPAGIGVILIQSGRRLKELCVHLGNQTNNVAEYTALIFGLQEAKAFGANAVKVYSDSQLLCRQVNNQYKIKSPNLIGLYHQVQHLLPMFDFVDIEHIPREKNHQADKLAKQAAKNKNCTQVKATALCSKRREESPDSRG